MGKDDAHLSSAKRSYREAKEVGNRHEEARWANVIGDILKNRGEYVQALKWLRIDYDVSVNHLPEKHVLPTCQSLGELYLRLRNFEDALYFQKKHLNLAKDAGNLVEQQRASTQLGRTYHDIYSESKADHSAVRNAKKYFNSAMRLAESLKKNPPSNSSSFVKEYIDAHNNIGMLELDLDNFEEAKNILMRGLEICDEEEINEYDDARSRLHHNLGNVYLELRAWNEARKHIDKDIMICRRIGHLQGEAKGCINLGELYYKMQKYEEAILSYQKALDLAKSMEDEDALVKQIVQNIKTVKQAMEVMDEIKAEEQNFKKLTRRTVNSKGTPLERMCLLQQNALLDCLIDKSSMIFAWSKHLEFAKRKKRIATELRDREKEGDSFLVLGESYFKLRNFNKAIKWYIKSWNTYKLIGSLEGQALAKINIGLILDCEGDWTGALSAFEESYRMALEANCPSTQIQALENMHYSHMIRFDNVEEARKLQQEIEKMEARSRVLENEIFTRDCCPETDTEEDLEECRSSAPGSPVASKSSSGRSNFSADGGELGDDEPLSSFFRSTKCSKQKKTACEETYNISSNPVQASPKCLSKSSSNPQKVIGRKRVRIVLSDDEDEMHHQEEHSEGRYNSCPAEDFASSDGCRRRLNQGSSSSRVQDFSMSASKRTAIDCSPMNVEESTSTHKSLTPEMVSPAGKVVRSSGNEEALFASDFSAGGSKYQNGASDDFAHNHSTGHLRFHDSVDNSKQSITFRIDSHQIRIQAGPYQSGNKLSIELMVVEVACLYYLQLPTEKRSKGLLPIIQHMACSGRVLESTETIGSLKDGLGNIQIEVSIGGWVQKRLMKLYIDCCRDLSEMPNMKLLKKLYLSEVEDEVVASDCELQDVSVTPLINALHAHKTVAMLNLSHNLLGNGTIEGIQQFFTSGQKYGDLTLDLHCNRFGPTALFQICECPVLFTRLEVLNISGNRLTDACGSYLSTILENCKALYSLNIERCSITTRTIQKVADALRTSSVLAQLCIGYNNPISGNVIVRLLGKIATLKSFAELNLSGLNVNKTVVDSLSELIKSSSLSQLMLGSTGIGNDGALQLSELLFRGSLESARFDLSDCGLTSAYVQKLTTDVALNCGIVDLNLGGNPLMPEGATAVASLLVNPQCCLKILVLNKCQLGITGLVQLVRALEENNHLEELHLADNAHLEKKYMLQHELTPKRSSVINLALSSPLTMCTSKNADIGQPVLCSVNYDCNDMEVADSEDEATKVEPAPSELDDSCTSSCLKNSSLDSLFIHELSTAISLAKRLQFLDLSKNGFSTEAAETLYAAWSSRLGSGLAWSHIEDTTIHFSLETSKCCQIKPCCRRD